MFTGDYLNDNIGHEIINLFKDDNEKNYIYLCKDGKYDIKNEEPDYVIQVRRPHNTTHTLEIINIATGISVFNGKQEDIKYGGVPVTEIFKYNSRQQDVCITFKAEKVIKPSSPIYIYYNGEKAKNGNVQVIELPDKFNVSQQLREYLYKDSDNHNIPSDFLAKCTGEELTQINPNIQTSHQATPADIYGIGTWELAYSNAFKFFMEKHNKFLEAFCNLCIKKYNDKIPHDKKVPPINDIKDNEHKNIYREWNHIDLLIDIKDYLFVIENKIFSDINGKKRDNKNSKNIITQLNTYWELIENKNEKGENKNPFTDKKYKIYILLTPNHNKINVSDENWKIIYYKDIINLYTTKDKDFNDFMSMIELHSVEDYNYGIMRRKFENAIMKIKNK